MSDSRPTLDQRRAKQAWQAVERAEHDLESKEARKSFARETKRLPVRIKTAGLGQSLAFLCAKSDGEDYRKQLLKEIGGWLLKERRLAPRPNGASDHNAMLQAIIHGDTNLLRRATEEALLYLQWLTRFSEAKFKPDEDADNA